jgi:hypothetical protein
MSLVQQGLADEVWTPCSVHAVVLSILRSEWDKWPRLRLRPDRRLISDVDPANAMENTQRASLLWSVRGPLLREIPTDTQWFEVKHLRGRHFLQLHAINFGDWNSAQDRNELEKVVIREPLPWNGSTKAWEPILWAHDRSGPFTILEGNHRLTGLAGSQDRLNCELVAYVGLSPSACIWHHDA